MMITIKQFQDFSRHVPLNKWDVVFIYQKDYNFYINHWEWGEMGYQREAQLEKQLVA